MTVYPVVSDFFVPSECNSYFVTLICPTPLKCSSHLLGLMNCRLIDELGKEKRFGKIEIWLKLEYLSAG